MKQGGVPRRSPRGVVDLWLRVNLRSLTRKPMVTALVILGIALGSAAFVAVLILVHSLGAPFASIASAGGRVDLQVSPLVRDRLPEESLRLVRQHPGVEVATPLTGGLTQLHAPGGRSIGVLLLGSDCSAEEILGPLDCETRLSGDGLAGGPGAALAVSTKVAGDLGVSLGDPLDVPGQPAGAAHVAAIIDNEDLGSLNGGLYALGSVTEAADLMNRGAFLTSILVDAPDSDVADSLGAALDGVATVGPPGSDVSMFLALTRGLLSFSGILMLVGGVMIAVNSYTLSLDDRRKSMAIVEVLGADPRYTVAAYGVEGLLLGALGGLVAIVPGYLLGSWLTESAGDEILAGTGASLSAPFGIWIVVAAVLVGAGSGLIAALLPAIRVIRAGSEVATREQAGVLPVHHAPSWPLQAAVPMVALGVPIIWFYGAGKAPLLAALAGIGLMEFGLVLAFFGMTPVLVRGLARFSRHAGAVGRIAASDLLRDPIRLATVVTTVGLGVGILLAVSSDRILASESLARNVSQEFEGNLHVFARMTAAQSENRLSPEVVEQIRSVDGVATADPVHHGLLRWGTNGINISSTPTEAGRRRANLATLVPDDEGMWQQVAGGAVIVSELLANRESIGVGDTIELPTVGGMRGFEVAAVARPWFGVDNGISDSVIVSDDSAQRYWAAPVDFVIVDTDDDRQDEVQGRLGELGLVGLNVMDTEAVQRQSFDGVSRFLGPVEITGYVMVVVALLAVMNFLVLGMPQRRRLRATLRFHGFDPWVERRTLLLQAGLMGCYGAVFGVVAGLLLSWVTTVASPALLANDVYWRLLPGQILLAAGTAVAACLIAAIPPCIQAGRLDLLQAITDE